MLFSVCFYDIGELEQIRGSAPRFANTCIMFVSFLAS
jgi:hypothetical protein